ncbi:MAG: DUF262 domain-containing protein [Ferruginibacter sp.]
MSDFYIEEFNLRKLKAKFDEKIYAIPQIQRSYVWKKDSVCKLMDSIFKNYPIGIALVWETKTSKAFEIRPNTKTIIPQYNKKASVAEVIIDGQQRLSTIYGVMNGIEPSKDVNSRINFNDLYFDTDKTSETRFIFRKSLTEHDKSLVNLTDLLNTQPSAFAKRQKLKKYQAKEVENCYTNFLNYKFNILKFTGFDFEHAREVFIRVNSAGMRLKRADELFALASSVHLRDHVEDTKRGLNWGFSEISDDAIQNTVALYYGAERIGGVGFKPFLNEVLKKNTKESDFLHEWKKIENGYKLCLDFLASEFLIKNLKELPISNMFSMLSFFFALNCKKATPLQLKQVRKWFWHTCLNKRYSGSEFNRNIPEDVKFFRSLANGKSVRYNIDKKVNVYDFMRSDYRDNGAVTVAYYLMLKRKNPLYLDNGRPMLLDNITSTANKKHRHHIFPKALLEANGLKAQWINCITNICFLDAYKNISIGSSLPKTYLTRFKDLKHFKKALTSYLIPIDNNSPVWATKVGDGFLDFINLRIGIITSEIEKIAGAELFEKFDGLKRL